MGAELKEGNYVRNSGRSVLSDGLGAALGRRHDERPNAPFGARCFLTEKNLWLIGSDGEVS